MPPSRDQRSDLLQVEGQVWRARVTEAKRRRTLEEENARRKKLLAEAMLDIAVLKDISAKKW